MNNNIPCLSFLGLPCYSAFVFRIRPDESLQLWLIFKHFMFILLFAYVSRNGTIQFRVCTDSPLFFVFARFSFKKVYQFTFPPAIFFLLNFCFPQVLTNTGCFMAIYFPCP